MKTKKSFKNKLIKMLGGHTDEEVFIKYDEMASNAKIIPVYSESKTYYIDDDTLEVEKEQLAYKIGKEMLDNNVISYTLKSSQDHYGGKIYLLRAKAFVNEVR